MAEQRSATQEELAKQIEQLRSDVAEISKTLGDLGKGQVDELRSRAERRVTQARDRGRAAADEITARACEIEGQAEDYVRDRPFQALAIAAGLGLLLGYLSRR